MSDYSVVLQQVVNGLSLGAMYALLALGFTLVYVTHDPDEAEALGTRTIHLRQGRIEQGSGSGERMR